MPEGLICEQNLKCPYRPLSFEVKALDKAVQQRIYFKYQRKRQCRKQQAVWQSQFLHPSAGNRRLSHVPFLLFFICYSLYSARTASICCTAFSSEESISAPFLISSHIVESVLEYSLNIQCNDFFPLNNQLYVQSYLL